MLIPIKRYIDEYYDGFAEAFYKDAPHVEGLDLRLTQVDVNTGAVFVHAGNVTAFAPVKYGALYCLNCGEHTPVDRALGRTVVACESCGKRYAVKT